ncbi:MAG TPA: zinc-binding dehydrogenase [Thermomicrobiaceae bacterium]|nr:zinc-binding dehydrogenase [Thermomicrobiaceae bacterium]
MPTMRAAVVHRRGGPEAIAIDDVPVPEIRPDEALVRVRACGLNRMDIWARTGPPQPVFPWKEQVYPVITGGDVAGEVAAVGSELAPVKVGDRVLLYGGVSCGTCEFCRRGEPSMCLHYHILGEHTQGGFAEYMAVPAANLEAIPAGVDFVTAAAIPAGFTTAWRLVETAGQVRAGDDVLVLAAGGGVGVAAIQIALRAGARVFAGASTEAKRRQAVALGATAAVDTTQPFSVWVLELTHGRGVDIVVDSLGATWSESIRSLAPGGRLVCCGATLDNQPRFDIRELYQRHRSIRGAPMGSRAEFNHVVRMVGRGLLTPVIDTVFPLDRIQDAHRRAESRESFGKIVVTI